MGLIGGLLPVLLRPSRLSLLSPESFVSRPALWLQTISRARRDRLGGTRLCLPPVRRTRARRAARRRRSFELALCSERGGGGVVAHAAGLRRALRPLGSEARSADSRLWTGRGSTRRDFQSCRKESFVARRFERSCARSRDGEAEATTVSKSCRSDVPCRHFEVEIRSPSGEALPDGGRGLRLGEGTVTVRGVSRAT